MVMINQKDIDEELLGIELDMDWTQGIKGEYRINAYSRIVDLEPKQRMVPFTETEPREAATGFLRSAVLNE